MRTFDLVNTDNPMPEATAPNPQSEAEKLDAAADQAIAACGGDRSRDQRCVRLHGPRTDPGAAISRQLRACQRRAGRSARRLSAVAAAHPRPLLPYTATVAAPASVHRLDGRAVPRPALAD
jgi:hypothetical protein